MLTCSRCVAMDTMGRCVPCACYTMLHQDSGPMVGPALWSVSHAGGPHDCIPFATACSTMVVLCRKVLVLYTVLLSAKKKRKKKGGAIRHFI